MPRPLHPRDRLQRLRRLGHLGGTIEQHRAIWRRSLPPARVAQSLVLALLFTAALLWLRPWVAAAWSAEILWWMRALVLPGEFLPGQPVGPGWIALTVPFVAPRLPEPDAWMPVRHGAVVLLLWTASGWLPDAAKPMAFFVRLGLLVHAASVAFFLCWPASFTHTVASHVGSGLRQTWYLMLAIPWVHLLTYYLFPFALWQRVALTALTLLFLVVLAPLQYALHAALVQRAGLIVMPVLNLLFGVMLSVVGVVALYGWGMGWPSADGERGRA